MLLSLSILTLVVLCGSLIGSAFQFISKHLASHNYVENDESFNTALDKLIARESSEDEDIQLLTCS